MGATSLGQPKVSVRGLPNLFDAGNPADVASQVAQQQILPQPGDVGMGILGGGGGGDVTSDEYDKQLKQLGQGKDSFWSLYE